MKELKATEPTESTRQTTWQDRPRDVFYGGEQRESYSQNALSQTAETDNRDDLLHSVLASRPGHDVLPRGMQLSRPPNTAYFTPICLDHAFVSYFYAIPVLFSITVSRLEPRQAVSLRASGRITARLRPHHCAASVGCRCLHISPRLRHDHS